MRTGVYPGSFDPLTTAHLAVAQAAIDGCALDRLDLVISTVALAKETGAHAPIAERIAAIEQHAQRDRRLGAVVTEHQLLADIAEGYDVLVVGADKWHQLHDVAFYGSAEARDSALERLPLLAVAPRAGSVTPAPAPDLVVLDLGADLQAVSSTAVRAGREDWRA
jgi:nicotinic acid mononucleotide adenylyltransferase